MTNMAKSYKLVNLDKGYIGVLLTIFQANFKIKSYLKICHCITVNVLMPLNSILEND